jgi:hypothetical protein
VSALAVLGLDPGPASGFVLLAWDAGNMGWPPDVVESYQCDAASAPDLLMWLLNRMPAHRLGAIEEFREGLLSVRTRNPADAKVTRALVPTLKMTMEALGVRVAVRPATTVKTWGERNDWDRMKKAGLYDRIPAKMIDARSAGVQAMYEAVHSGNLPDPLSKRAKGKG